MKRLLLALVMGALCPLIAMASHIHSTKAEQTLEQMIGRSGLVEILTINGRAAPPLSPTSQGRIYFDSTSMTFQISENGGAYETLLTGPGGVLPPSGGGTGTSTVFTEGSVVFAGPSGIYAQDNSNFFWNDSTNSLGIGISAAPLATLHVAISTGTAAIIEDTNAGGELVIRSSKAPLAGNVAARLVLQALDSDSNQGNFAEVRAIADTVTNGAEVGSLLFFTTIAAASAERARIHTNGFLGIGTSSPTNIISMSGQAARSVWMERNTTSNTAGNNLTLQSGGATSGATNKSAGTMYVQSGISTGSGTGSIIFSTSPGIAASTTDNTVTDRWQITGPGNFISGADNTYDIGASGATRPRTGYFGTSIITPVGTFATSISTPTATISNITSGSVLFAGTGGLVSEDNTNLFFNNSTNRLGIGTNAPTSALEVVGRIEVSQDIQLTSTYTPDLDTPVLNDIVNGLFDIVRFKTPYDFEYWDGGAWVAFSPTQPQRITSGVSSITITDVQGDTQFRFVLDTANVDGMRAKFFVVRGNKSSFTSYTIDFEGSDDDITYVTRGSTVTAVGGSPAIANIIPWNATAGDRYIRFTFTTNLSAAQTFSLFEVRVLNSFSRADSNFPAKWDLDGNVGIGDTTPNGRFGITQSVFTGTVVPLLHAQSAAHTALTASTERIDVDFSINSTMQWDTGALTNQRFFLVRRPTIAFVGASTVTNAAVFSITGVPTAGSNATITNSHAILVSAASAVATNAYGLTVNASTGATNNYAAQFLGGNVGFQTSAPTNIISLSGQAVRTIWMERQLTANSNGGSLTLQAGGATLLATDKAGGQLILAPGANTGTGRSTVAVKGYTVATATGTSDGTQVDRAVFGAFKALTDNSAIAIVNATVASNTIASGVVRFAVEVFDGTDLQVEEGQAFYHVTNKGGSIANNEVNVISQQALTSGTLTVTFAITAANPAVLSINANSSLTPSAGYPRVTYELTNLTGQAVAVQ